MRKQYRFTLLMGLCAALVSCGGGGGGGGTSSVADALERPVADMAGVYDLADSTGFARALVDDQGRMFVTSQTFASSQIATVNFSGVATSSSGGGWSMRNALVFSTESAGSPVSTASADITGSHSPGTSVTVAVPSPPAPTLFRANFTMRRDAFASGPEVPLSALTGRYQGISISCNSTPTNGVTCPVVTDYTLDASGRLQGRLDNCDFSGTLSVVPQRNVVRATGTLTGPDCPGATTLLGVVSPDTRHWVNWWYVRPDGRVQMNYSLQQ